MKIALVHDYIKEYGGAERVLEALHEMWPSAPVYTLVYLPEFLGPHKGRFKNWKIQTSFFQYIPFKEKLISPFRLLAPFVFRMFDFSQFDVVIVSATGAYSPNAVRKGSAVQVSYVHTPPRYLYGYATAREWKKNPLFKILGEVANHFLRLVDYRSAQNVDYFIANSEEVASRIRKFYRKEAVIIYPPVDVSFQKTQNTQKARKSDISDNQKARHTDLSEFSESSENYYLAGGRLARPKHIDLIIEAFQKLNRPLKIFGRGFAGYEKELSIINDQLSNIKFFGEVSDEEKFELMRNAKAYIFASEDEDFGITPVEAMAVGTPVIAYRSGGVKETVIDRKTGVFFDELNIESMLDAIKRFDKIKIESEDCRKRAEQFSKGRFKKEIQEFMAKVT